MKNNIKKILAEEATIEAEVVRRCEASVRFWIYGLIAVVVLAFVIGYQIGEASMTPAAPAKTWYQKEREKWSIETDDNGHYRAHDLDNDWNSVPQDSIKEIEDLIESEIGSPPAKWRKIEPGEVHTNYINVPIACTNQPEGTYNMGIYIQRTW